MLFIFNEARHLSIISRDALVVLRIKLECRLECFPHHTTFYIEYVPIAKLSALGTTTKNRYFSWCDKCYKRVDPPDEVV